MQENVRPTFLPLTSQHSVVLTWLLNSLGGILLAGLFFLLACLPFLVSRDSEVRIIVGLIFYPLWAYALYRFIRYIKNKMAGAIRNIRIDEKGIHFDKKKGNTVHIPYDLLGPSSRSTPYDVYLVPVNKTQHLAFGLQGVETTLVFDGSDIGSVSYIKNGRALRAKFIEGIARFRPDLTIDPAVFKAFSIHPQKFTFDGKQYRKHVLQGLLMLVGLLALGCLITLLLTLF
ncbi:hypothetical protein [Myroides sp. DW712]|uniref:hypothetical protein n=1 Tax=Myroides sp. DW712 TaxID=3389800 RepID=UPI003977F8A4